MGNKTATIFVSAMATWRFIFCILTFCLIEIFGNTYGIFHFDPTMIVLNTILSLWAAVQGSIIMINQNQVAAEQEKAQATRDELMSKILFLEEIILEIKDNTQKVN